MTTASAHGDAAPEGSPGFAALELRLHADPGGDAIRSFHAVPASDASGPVAKPSAVP